MKDISPVQSKPVSRWELIDAIAKLHVIQDCPTQLITVRNNSKVRSCVQLTQVEQKAHERSV